MTKLLTRTIVPFLKLWLRSQVEGVAQLDIDIDSGDGQLLQGNIPYAQVTARDVRYQGLEAAYVRLVAQAIHLNLPQVLQGQPLQLLDPIVVHVHLSATRTQLQQALQSPLVTAALGYGVNPHIPAGEMQSVLSHLLQSLGVQIDHLEIDADGISCQVQLQIKAT
ncbi:MAG: DUF2993 domain-containing protein [Pseudanabaenaceae cyanobacterium SKYGB_i_bin29]|nr:DUF2993 domain-containing protein [Pseudanabaenaceae cyanobacterium SKYG29]MDW8421336.1 DUF2993 domain-containing protein [Pseudanabaenaceae cyanobacterium SKYGB_i_bin29]